MEHDKIVKSADRAILILEMFGELRRPMSQKEIVGFLNIPQTSVNSILKSMCRSGHLNYNNRFRTYFPTSRVRQLGSWLTEDLPNNSAVHEIMSRARERFGETVAVGVQSDLYLQYLKAIESDHVGRYRIRDGFQRPLTDSSMGMLLLSRLHPAKAELVCRRINAISAPAERLDLAGTMKELHALTLKDHCVAEDRNIPYPATTVAMLLPIDFNGQPIAIGVGGFTERIVSRRDEIVETLRALLAT